MPPLGVVLPQNADAAAAVKVCAGFSCRTQLAAGRTGRQGLHLAQLPDD